MLRWYPYVPVGGEMAVNCAILSYDGMMYFGFSGNVQAAPDLRRLEKFVRESFDELREAAGIKAQRKRTVRRKKARTVNKRAKSRAAKPVNGSATASPTRAVASPDKEQPAEVAAEESTNLAPLTA
jgi:hypothetical protein